MIERIEEKTEDWNFEGLYHLSTIFPESILSGEMHLIEENKISTKAWELTTRSSQKKNPKTKHQTLWQGEGCKRSENKYSFNQNLPNPPILEEASVLL